MLVLSMTGLWRCAVAVAALAASALPAVTAFADDGFPFGFEMTLEAAPQPGSKRIPTLEIGDNGEARLDLWCKSGNGQFSVAGNTVIFVPGELRDRDCPPARAQADDDLLAALSEAVTWKRRGDLVSFIGTRALRFRINTN
jgi:META domain